VLTEQLLHKAIADRRRQRSRKTADSDSGNGVDVDIETDSQTITEDGSRESPSPSQDIVSESGDKEKLPQRGWKYHGLGRWTQTQEGEGTDTTSANTDPSSAESYLVIVRHIDGSKHQFEIRGNLLEERAPFFRAARSARWTEADSATVLEEDVNFFERTSSPRSDGTISANTSATTLLFARPSD